MTVVLFFFFFFFVLELPDSFPVIIHFSLFSISYVISSNIKEGSVRRIHKGRYLKEEELHFSCFLSSLIVTFLLKFNERSLTMGGRGGGGGEVRYYFKSEGLKILAPLRLTAQKSCPLKKCVPEKFVTLPCNNILSIQCCTLRIHMSVTLRQFFIGIKKKTVSIHNIYKTHFFLFVNSITTQQFNNH